MQCGQLKWLHRSDLAREPLYKELWYRLKSGDSTYTIAGVQHQSWKVVIYLRRHGHNFLSRNTVTWRPARGTSQHRTPQHPQNISRGTRQYTFHTFLRSTKHVYTYLACSQGFSKICWSGNCSVVLRQCCNLSGGVALIVWFTTNGLCAKNKNKCMWREQAIIEWSRRVISIVACCHGAKLCAYAARDFRSQHENRTGYHPALVQWCSWHHGKHSFWETEQRDVAGVGSFTPDSLFVYGDVQFANLSVPFQNAMPVDTQPPGVLSSPNPLSNFSQLVSSSGLAAASESLLMHSSTEAFICAKLRYPAWKTLLNSVRWGANVDKRKAACWNFLFS